MLNKTTLESSIKAAFNAVQADIAGGKTADQAQTDLASALANAFDTYVKGATVNVPALAAGSLIAPPGTAGGPVTGTTASGNGTLS